MFMGGCSRIWICDEDEGWSEALRVRFCVGSESGTDTEGADSVTGTDSSATVSITDSGMVFS